MQPDGRPFDPIRGGPIWPSKSLVSGAGAEALGGRQAWAPGWRSIQRHSFSRQRPQGLVISAEIRLFCTPRQGVLGEAALELGQHLFGLDSPPLTLQLLDPLEPFLG